MTLVSISPGWRAFSQLCEATFGTAQARASSLAWSGEPVDTEPGKVWTNKDEYNGELAPTQQQTLTWKFETKHSQLMQPHNAALFLSMLLGSCTDASLSAGPPAAYSHKILMDATDLEPPTRTMEEYDGANALIYPGVACSKVDISCEREDFAKIEATLIGMGKETDNTPVPTRPAVIAENYLTYGDGDIKLGVTYAGTNPPSSGTSIASRVRSFKVGISNGAKMVYLFNDATGYAGRVVRARQPQFDVELDLEFADRTEKAALLASTETSLYIPLIGATITGAHKFQVSLIFPRVTYNKPKKGVDDGVLLLNAGFTVMSDLTYGPCVIWINNSQAAYTATS